MLKGDGWIFYKLTGVMADGQIFPAVVDGVVEGRVSRIDPAVQNGTVRLNDPAVISRFTALLDHVHGRLQGVNVTATSSLGDMTDLMVIASGGQVHWAPTAEDAVKTVPEPYLYPDFTGQLVPLHGDVVGESETLLAMLMSAVGLLLLLTLAFGGYAAWVTFSEMFVPMIQRIRRGEPAMSAFVDGQLKRGRRRFGSYIVHALPFPGEEPRALVVAIAEPRRGALVPGLAGITLRSLNALFPFGAGDLLCTG